MHHGLCQQGVCVWGCRAGHRAGEAVIHASWHVPAGRVCVGGV